MITPYSGQVRKLRDSLGKIFSVQLSDEDKDAVAMLDSLETGQEATSIIVGKPLTQSVRIATVKASSQAVLMLIGGQFPRRKSQSHYSFIGTFK